MATTSTHPVDRLAEAESFDEALALLGDGYQMEAGWHGVDAVEDSFWGHYERQRQQALAIYRKRYISAMNAVDERITAETVAALREVGLDTYADALESGDYGALAF